MRRLSILLVAALVAVILSAIASSAGALEAQGSASNKPKYKPVRYTALAAAPSLVGFQTGAGKTKQAAKKNALYYCRYYAQDISGYRGDCQGAVWVYNGWVAGAYEKTKEKPYKNLDWGSGWGPTSEEAAYQARRVCRGFAQENCTSYGGYKNTGAYKTQDLDRSLPTRGGSW